MTNDSGARSRAIPGAIRAARFAAGLASGAILIPLPSFAQSVPVPVASPAPSPPVDPCASLPAQVSRPSVSLGACSVKAGTLLIESGYSNTTTAGAGAGRFVNYPQATLRGGLGRGWELDVLPSSYLIVSGPPRVAGTADGGVALKYQLPALGSLVHAVQAGVTLNTGSAAFSGNGSGAALDYIFAYSASPAIGIFGTAGYGWQSAGPVGAPVRFAVFSPSLGVSAALPGGSAVFIEGFGTSSAGPGTAGRYGLNAGVQHDIGQRLQVDLNYNRVAPANAHTVGFGVSYLIGGG